MKLLLTFATLLALAGSAAAVGSDAPLLPTAKEGKLEKTPAKADKQAANQLQKQAAKSLAQPLSAQILKIERSSVTVKTQPMMGPDGLIPAREKTYNTSNATIVIVNGEPKTLADLSAGAPARIQITDDGRTIEQIESKTQKPAAKTAAPKKDPAAKPGAGIP